MSTFGFWTIETDSAYDFQYYFKEYNPNRLRDFKMYSHKGKAK